MSLKPHWTAGVHHDGSSLYVSNPLPAAGETVTIKLRTPLDAPIESVFLRSYPDGEMHQEEMLVCERNAVCIWWMADLHITMPRTDYRFKLLTPDGAYYYNAAGIQKFNSPDWFDFTLLAGYEAPLWVRESVFYQIFADRFHNGDPTNDVEDGQWVRKGFKVKKRRWGELPEKWEKSGSVDFFGGDLQGIAQKLDYIHELGITALYLTPIFHSLSNHRYDIVDFLRVDPHAGGDEGLAELRRALDERDMRLMLDITPNHISYAHPWFVEATRDKKAPTAEYFAIDKTTGAFETWLGVSSLIKLNYSSQKLRDVMYRDPDSALRYWLREPYRIDAWRLDVANMMGNLKWHQLGSEVGRELRAALKADDPQFYIMGEYFQDGTMHLQGDELDAGMNYQGFNVPVRRWLGGADIGVEWDASFGDPRPMDTDAMAEQWRRFMAAVPYAITLQQFNQLSSHDINRILTVVKGDKALVRLGMAMLMTFPGVPCVYYGDEIGLEGGKDPDNRRCMPWDEADWDHDMLAFYKKVIGLRRSCHALAHGGFQTLYAAGDLVVYQRQSTDQRILFAGCRGPGPAESFTVPVWHGGLADGTTLTDLLAGGTYTVRDGMLSFTLAHGQALVLEAG